MSITLSARGFHLQPGSSVGAMKSADLHETAAERLRGSGQRYTAGRRRLVELLATGPSPCSLPELLATDRTVPQSSAYRNLVVLEEAGVVRKIVTRGDFARYELAEDLTGHHHHLECAVCGGVEDFTVSPAVERSLARVVATVEHSTGFSAQHHRFDLVGTCAHCA
jgi:Fur family ferric uptake transcriptional regulator